MGTDATMKDQNIYAQCQRAIAMEDVYGEDMSLNESDIHKMDNMSKQQQSIWNNDEAVVLYNKPLPNKPKNISHKLQVFSHNSVNSQSRDSPQSYSKDLPMPSFDVQPYKVFNFIACLTDPRHGKMRYLNYSNKGYNIIPTLVFAQIDQIQNKNQGIVTINDVQFGQDCVFSFLQKLDNKYPYKLAIRVQDHQSHMEDAKKLLKYAEYKLNQHFNSMQRMDSTSFDLEPCFDGIARELLARGGTGFATFDNGFGAVPKQTSISIQNNRPALYNKVQSVSVELT